MYTNHTTPHFSPRPAASGYYALIPAVLLILIGCVVAGVLYIRRRVRLEELRHRLIPRYAYDPTEEDEEWDDTSREEEDELTEPLYKEGRLSLSSIYGT